MVNAAARRAQALAQSGPEPEMHQLTWGSEAGTYLRVKARRLQGPRTSPQALPGYRAGFATDRTSQDALPKAVFGNFGGGLAPRSDIGFWQSEVARSYVRNEGLQTRGGALPVPWPVTLPYVLTNTTSHSNEEDPSGFNAANKRRHAISTTLGGSAFRRYEFVGARMYRNGTGSTSSLSVVSANFQGAGNNTTMPGNATAVGEPHVAGARALALALDSGDDVVYTTDPTATNPAFSQLVALGASDRIDAIWWFPDAGPAGICVMAGTIGGVAGLWWEHGTASAPWTMKPLNDFSTRNDFDPNAVVQNTGFVAPYEAVVSALPGDIGGGGPGTSVTISNVGNVLASDDQRATYPQNQAATNTNQITGIFTSYDFRATLPAIARLVGTEVTIERSETADTVNANDLDVVLGTLGPIRYPNMPSISAASASPIYTPRSNDKASATEWPTTEAAATYGGATDLWGCDLSVSEWRGANVGLFHRWAQVNVVSQFSGVDQYLMKHYFILPGSQVKVTTGGYTKGISPDEPLTAYLVQPVVSDETAITQPRKLVKFQFTWIDDRMCATRSEVFTGMTNVHDYAHYAGGILVTGDHAGGPGRLLHLINSEGRLITQKFYGVHGTTEVRINSIQYVQGVYAVLDVVNADFSDRQWWILFDGTCYPDYPLQGKSSLAITEEPVYSAETAIDIANDRIYAMFPNGANCAVSRAFLPRDLSTNPELTNTSEVKQMAWSAGSEQARLFLYVGELDVSPPEANKMALRAHLHSRHVDDNTAYGSVVLDATTDGSVPDGTDAVNLTWNAAPTHSAFGVKNIPSGVVYRTLYPRIGMGHQAGSAETPALGNIVIETSQDWEELPIWVFEVDRESVAECVYVRSNTSYFGFDAWRQFANDGLVRPLKFGDEDPTLSKWGGWSGDQWLPMPNYGNSPDYKQTPPLLLAMAVQPGSVT